MSKRIILTESDLMRMVKHVLNEWEQERVDITSDIKRYVELCQMSEFDSAQSSVASIEASKLHDSLMNRLYLDHEDEDDRLVFAKILANLRSLLSLKEMDIRIYDEGGSFTAVPGISTDSSATVNSTSFDAWEISNDKPIQPILYSEYGDEGIEYDKSDDCHGVDGGNGCGLHYHITDEMRDKIYGMGLIPGIQDLSTYHNSIIHVVGVAPSLAKYAERYGINLKCKK